MLQHQLQVLSWCSSGIQIETGGTGYRRGDFLAVDDDELEDLEHLSVPQDLPCMLIMLVFH